MLGIPVSHGLSPPILEMGLVSPHPTRLSDGWGLGGLALWVPHPQQVHREWRLPSSGLITDGSARPKASLLPFSEPQFPLT